MREIAIRELALHEAAHACVALVVGLPVAGVAIDTGVYPGRLHGACWPFEGPIDAVAEWVAQDIGIRYERPAPYRGRRLDEYLMCLLAGSVAVAHARGVPYTAIQPDGYHDRFNAEWLAAEFAGHPYPGAWVHALLLVIEDAARRHVIRHWAWLQATAAALLEDKVLTGDQVRALRPRRDR